MKEKWIQISRDDNVAVALQPLKAGEEIRLEDSVFDLKEDIEMGHKFALKDFSRDQKVIKYGHPIGSAKQEIGQGEWIHTHNLKTNLSDQLDYTYQPALKENNIQATDTFMGYRRKNGKAGIRNELLILPTVGCVNPIVNELKNKARKQFPHMEENILSFNHPYGCSQMGDDQENTRQILADLISHPNAGGVLVVGLGCENSNIDVLKTYIKDADADRIEYLVCQDAEDEIEEGLSKIASLAKKMETDQREPLDAGELVVGLKCGGSDGLSGITANPAVGAFSDLLVKEGGTTLLTEVPEMFGAETILMNRAENQELFDQIVSLINDFKDYFQKNDQTIYENPSPGNKKGGISTLEDKSLGCVQKAGTSNVKGVLKYGQPVQKHGLNLLCAPGNDLVAATALAASGAHMVLFTTGRGTPFASPVPTVKISTNENLARKKSRWIDFDASGILEGVSIEDMGKQLYAYVLQVASGQRTSSEQADYHDMAIFKQGVTL